MANEALGNVMTRLAGVKNVSRKVMPTPPFMEDLAGDEDVDVAGTAQPLPEFANFLPQDNAPQEDLGGELTSQSYDVRANTANPPENEQNPEQSAWYRRLGQALGDYFSPEKRAEVSAQNQAMFERNRQPQAAPQAPPVQTAQVDMQEGLPPVTASEQEYVPPRAPETSPGVFGAIADYFSPTKRAEMGQYNQDILTNAQLQAQGKNPAEVISKRHEEFQNDVQKAMQNPWQYSAYGSAEEVANSPALQAEFKKITGTNYEPQIAAQVSKTEEAMKGVEDALNGINTQLSEQANGIKERIINNQTTDADKYYIGLALLMPLIIGGIFGKEAGLGALGGAAQGVANVLGGRQKGIKEDEAALADLAKQQAQNQEKLANIGLEKAKIESFIRKSLPEDQNQHLQGMREIDWTDPATGQPQKGIEVKPGLVARAEFVNSKEGLNDIRKAANELSETKTYVDEVNDITDDIVEIVSQLKDPSNVWKGFTQILTHKSPTSLAALSQDVDFDGRKQNAGVLLEEKLGFLANKYGMAQELGQLDRAAQNHIKKIVENPTNSFLTPRDSISQIMEIRKLAQNGLVRSASNKGFIPEFVIQDLEKENSQFFGKLNKQEGDKRLQERKRQALQSETNYAK